MFHKTESILFKKTKLSGGGLILKFYTKEFGIRSYFGRSSKKEKNSYLPLTMATITAYENSKKSIQNIKDYEVTNPLRGVFQDIYKSNVLMFLNEILNKVIQEEQANNEKFDFLKSQLSDFDSLPFDPNFHLIFLVKLMHFIGIEPNMDGTGIFLDLEEGELISSIPLQPNFFDEHETKLFLKLNNNNLGGTEKLLFSNQERKRTLQLLVTYYRYHTDMKELKSLPVLEVIFS